MAQPGSGKLKSGRQPARIVAAVAKTVGGILTVLGVVGLVAGLAAAAYGFYDNEQNRKQLIIDQDRSDEDQALIVAGAALASGGLVLFLAGLITLLTSRPKPTPIATPAEPATSKGASTIERRPSSLSTPAAMPDDPARRNAILAATVAVLLVALVVAGLVFFQRGSDNPFFGGGDPEPVQVLDVYRNGTVQGSELGPLGPVYQGSSNSGSFQPPAEARACTLTLTWDGGGPAGAEQLRLEVERGGAAVANQTGSSGLQVQLVQPVMAGVAHAFTVLLAPSGTTPGVVSQPFSLHVVCTK